MKKIKNKLSKYLLVVMSAMPVFLIPAFISCREPSYLEENRISPWDLEWSISVSIEAGDGFVTLLNSSPIVSKKGSSWASIKAEAEKKVSFISGYEFDSWRLGTLDGEELDDEYIFNSYSKVFARSKVISSADKITITVKSNEQMKVAGGQASLVINKNKPWSEVRNQAEGLIIADAGYEIDKWMLGTPPMGAELQDSHLFQDMDTIYATAKQLSDAKITITVKGDSNITVSQPQHIDVERGAVWGKVKKLVEAKVSANPGYILGKWYLTEPGGIELANSYEFKNSEIVYIDTDPLPENKAHLIVAHDEHLSVSNHKMILIERHAKWSSLKDEVESNIKPLANYRLKKWHINDKDGAELEDSYEFASVVNTIFAESEAIGGTQPSPDPEPKTLIITIEGKDGSHVSLDGHKAPFVTLLTKLVGITWNEVRTEMSGRIKAEGARELVWSLIENGENLSGSYKFEKNTKIYVRGKLPDGLHESTDANHPTLVAVDGATVEGHNPTYRLPRAWKEDEAYIADFKGIFTQGKTVTLKPYKIDKYEVTQKLWQIVKNWAEQNGYTGLNKGAPSESHSSYVPNRAITNIAFYDTLLWCNAYTEMTMGAEHCVYLEKENGEVLRNRKKISRSTYFDKTKKGYRLPTEAEWEYAARWQGFEGDSVDKTNAEKYGNVYLTRLDSPSGAKKPFPFKGVDKQGFSWDELKEEAERVMKVFNWWYEPPDDREIYEKLNGSLEQEDVGSREPNALGLYGMTGFLAEYCIDEWALNKTADETLPIQADPRVSRGVSHCNINSTRIPIVGGRSILYIGSDHPIKYVNLRVACYR